MKEKLIFVFLKTPIASILIISGLIGLFLFIGNSVVVPKYLKTSGVVSDGYIIVEVDENVYEKIEINDNAFCYIDNNDMHNYSVSTKDNKEAKFIIKLAATERKIDNNNKDITVELIIGDEKILNILIKGN